MPFNLVPQVYAQDACDPGSGGENGGINLTKCIKDNQGNSIYYENEVYQSISGFTNHIVVNLFIIAGIILFLMVIYAGFKLVQGGKSSMDDAKTIMQNALLGFLIMFCAYWIVQVIEYITGAGILI